MNKDTYDMAVGIIAYENGELNQQETIELFQRLINSGMAFKLQGHYGRMAASLIERGLCTPKLSPNEKSKQ